MTHSRAARRYAAALMAAAVEVKAVDAVTEDMLLIAATLRDSRELRLLIASPIINAPRKRTVFQALFGPRVNTHTMTFLDLLITKQREGILVETIEQYMKLRDIAMGIVNISVVAAIALTSKQEDALRGQMERMTGKKVRLHPMLDPGIKGGLIVRIGDTVLDASVKHQLEVLGERFTRGEYAGPGSV